MMREMKLTFLTTLLLAGAKGSPVKKNPSAEEWIQLLGLTREEAETVAKVGIGKEECREKLAGDMRRGGASEGAVKVVTDTSEAIQTSGMEDIRSFLETVRDVLLPRGGKEKQEAMQTMRQCVEERGSCAWVVKRVEEYCGGEEGGSKLDDKLDEIFADSRIGSVALRAVSAALLVERKGRMLGGWGSFGGGMQGVGGMQGMQGMGGIQSGLQSLFSGGKGGGMGGVGGMGGMGGAGIMGGAASLVSGDALKQLASAAKKPPSKEEEKRLTDFLVRAGVSEDELQDARSAYHKLREEGGERQQKTFFELPVEKQILALRAKEDPSAALELAKAILEKKSKEPPTMMLSGPEKDALLRFASMGEGKEEAAVLFSRSAPEGLLTLKEKKAMQDVFQSHEAEPAARAWAVVTRRYAGDE